VFLAKRFFKPSLIFADETNSCHLREPAWANFTQCKCEQLYSYCAKGEKSFIILAQGASVTKLFMAQFTSLAMYLPMIRTQVTQIAT
jgi:hypothetical protein